MEVYEGKTIGHGIFAANMTVDTEVDTYSTGANACKSCQCNCRMCIGGIAPAEAEALGNQEAESALVTLLAA